MSEQTYAVNYPRINKRIKKLGLTKTEVSKAMGFSNQYLSSMESQNCRMTKDYLRALNNILYKESHVGWMELVVFDNPAIEEKPPANTPTPELIAEREVVYEKVADAYRAMFMKDIEAVLSKYGLTLKDFFVIINDFIEED